MKEGGIINRAYYTIQISTSNIKPNSLSNSISKGARYPSGLKVETP